MFSRFFKNSRQKNQHSSDQQNLPLESDADLITLLLQYQKTLGDITTQKAFDSGIPIAYYELQPELFAAFAHDGVLPEKSRPILMSKKSSNQDVLFFHFAHEARHYTQNIFAPNFHLLSRVVPEKAPFCRHICELDAYLYEGEKAAFGYIKDKNSEKLNVICDQAGSGVKLYAAAMELIVTGKTGDLSFKSTKAILDKFPSLPSSDKYIQTTRAYFSYCFSTEKDFLSGFDNSLIYTLPAIFQSIYSLPDQELLPVQKDIFKHSPGKQEAEALLYRDNPNKKYLDELPKDLHQEFWQNISNYSDEYKSHLVPLKEASIKIRKDLTQRFGI